MSISDGLDLYLVYNFYIQMEFCSCFSKTCLLFKGFFLSVYCFEDRFYIEISIPIKRKIVLSIKSKKLLKLHIWSNLSIMVRIAYMDFCRFPLWKLNKYLKKAVRWNAANTCDGHSVYFFELWKSFQIAGSLCVTL